jgi:type I restriction-modification system DNA methylase subunit
MAKSQLKKEIRKDLERLIANFRLNRADYVRRNSDFDETETRTNFIDPLFYALNWDVNNKQGKPPTTQEVRREKGPTAGEPDYTFRVPHPSGVTPVFFVEAKAPRENLDNPKHVFQARSYAFSAAQSSLVLAVLTNFDRFKLYRVDDEPHLDDDVTKGLIYDWSFEEYLTKIDELINFERNEVTAGSLNTLGRHGAPVKQRPPIEAPFLRRLEGYRDKIARSIFTKTRNVSDDILNSATETIINRLVFIRFAEDRDILPQEDLKSVVTQWRNRRGESLIDALNTYFVELDRRFNGRLFAQDETTLSVKLENEVLADVIDDLYPPRCPFRFNQIRVELLGDIYERHLGKIILRRGRGIKIEEKPEVRHAKGVYYTPTYIVEGILERTLRPVLERCSSVEDFFSLKGIDPACGSGSFLLGAYRMLHDEILHRAVEEKKGAAKYLELESDGSYRLNFKTKRRILEECLHGIDIDRRAVRVAELSLYLKLLEDEPDVSRNPIPYLPKLESNLQCGNSLIDSAMIQNGNIDLSDSLFNRVNPFSWERKEAFGAIMKSGGFSWVMGNPPYIRIQALREFSSQETDVIRKHYDVVGKGNPDIYVAFIKRSLDKLQDGGALGFIVSHKFMITDYGAPIRKELSTRAHVKCIVDFGDKQVFDGASTYTCILVAEKKAKAEKTLVRIVDTDPAPGVLAPNVLRGVRDIKVDLAKFGEKPWEWQGSTIGQSRKGFRKLKDLCEIFQGVRTSDDGVFVLKNPTFQGKYVTGFSKAAGENVTVEVKLTRPFLKGREIGRNAHAPIKNVLIFPYYATDPYKLIPWSKLKKEFPKAAAYFERCRSRLRERQRGNYDLTKWYGFIRMQNHDMMSEPKVMIQAVSARAHMTFDPDGEAFFVTGYGLHFKNSRDIGPNHYEFVQALLQTNFNDRQVKSRTSKLRGGFSEYRKQFLADLLIPEYDPKNAIHREIVDTQREVAKLASRLITLSNNNSRKEIQHQIEELENKIESLAAKLYGQKRERVA